MKKGEREARTILENKGYEFDYKYYDDNSMKSMPDFKYCGNRYLEITHTKHNYRSELMKYERLDINTRCETEIKVGQAIERLRNIEYQRNDEDKLTEESIKQISDDKKLVMRHFGTIDDSETNVDIITRTFSSDNILYEICNDKGKKYKDKSINIDLFIYVSKEELDSALYLLEAMQWNMCSAQFVGEIVDSPFKVIFLCVWDLEQNAYQIDNADIIRITKSENGVKWEKI